METKRKKKNKITVVLRGYGTFLNKIPYDVWNVSNFGPIFT